VLGQRASVGTGVCEVVSPFLGSPPVGGNDPGVKGAKALGQDVVFTAVDYDVASYSSEARGLSQPVDMPFAREPNTATNRPLGAHHSFLGELGASSGVPNQYAPSSPRPSPSLVGRNLKRKYEPSSPRRSW
jgi:hypothetical protein